MVYNSPLRPFSFTLNTANQASEKSSVKMSGTEKTKKKIKKVNFFAEKACISQ